MATLKQSLSVDGVQLSNKDPKLAITLDDHPVVQISDIGEDTVTYSFATRVKVTAEYKLNVTFTYEGYLPLVVPLTFTHNATGPDLVAVDAPITATMWQVGSNPPFGITLDGASVTGSITELAVGANDFVKIDSDTTPSRKVWEVLYADPEPRSTLVPFTYSYTEDGKKWAFTSEGTFNIPAWDGIAFKVVPHANNDPLFVNAACRVGTSAIVNIDGWFKNARYAESRQILDPTKHDLVNGSVVVSPGKAHWSTGLPVYITGKKIGKIKPKIAFRVGINNGGYPANTDNLTITYWQPNITITDTVAMTADNLTIPANSDATITLTLKQSDGVLISGAVAKTINLVPSVNDGTVVVSHGELVETSTPGQYTLDVKTGAVGGTFALDLVLTIREVDCPTNKLTFTKPAAPVLNLEWITAQEDLVPASSNQFIFKLTDGSGALVTGATRKSISFESVPKNAPQICGGYSNTLVELGNGEYYVSGNLGHVAGQIKIDLVLIKDNVEFVIPTKTVEGPGTPVKLAFTPNTLASGDSTTEVTIEIRQDTYGTANKLMTGQITSLNLSGGGTTDSVTPIVVTDGLAKFNVTPTGTVTDVVINGVFSEPATEVMALPRDFSGSISVTQTPVNHPVLENQTTSMTLNLWGSDTTAYKVMLGEEDISSSVTGLVISNLSSLNEWMEFSKTEENMGIFKAIKADKDVDTQLTVNGVINGTYQGEDYSLVLDIEVVIKARGEVSENRFDVEFV